MRAKRRLSTNEVFEEYARKNAKITMRKLDKNDVLIEGDRVALEFLGNLLLTCSASKEHSVNISPKGAGSARFTRESTLGIYIHRLPCPDREKERRVVPKRRAR